jgi:hypothetical protein
MASQTMTLKRNSLSLTRWVSRLLGYAVLIVATVV